jgi:hypothetical protein
MIAWGVDAGGELVRHAGFARCIAVIGTAKNVGKTTALRAMCRAVAGPFGALSVGRDGESRDVMDSLEKPELDFASGTLLATARSLVARSPACEVIAQTRERGALGPIVIVRTRAAGAYEIAGPASAPALRRVVDLLFELGARRVLIDGALDRMAALREGDAVVVATGAAAAPSVRRLAELTAGIVRRLRTPPFDPRRPFVRIDGALTSERASELARAGEIRQVVVADATRILARGAALDAIDVRCERSVRPIACTVSSRSPHRSFDPRELLEALAQATGLPAYDVYAGARA